MNPLRRLFSRRTPDAPSPPTPTSGDADERKDQGVPIHFVMKGAPGAPKESILITVAVRRIAAADGTFQNIIQGFRQADPLSFFEANSAIYWQDFLDREGTNSSLCTQWLQSAQQASGNIYSFGDGGNIIPNEVALMTGLTQLSLHYTIARISELGFPATVVAWFRLMVLQGPSPDRMRDLERGGNLDAALGAGLLEPELLAHLRRSVGGKKDARPGA